MNDTEIRKLMDLAWRRQLTAAELSRLDLWFSTHPESRSGWLKKDVVEKAKKFKLPVRHVVSHVPEQSAV